MRITIDVKAHYEWEPVPAGVEPTPEDIKNLLVKPDVGGRWLMKVTKQRETHTDVGIHEEQIDALIEAGKRNGEHTTRARAVAMLIEKIVCKHHAHPQHFKAIHVAGEPAIESFLNNYFEVVTP